MADTMSIQVRVSFTNETPIGDYSDCLVYKLADFFDSNGKRKITNVQLRDAIQAKTQVWREAVRVARERVTPEPTLEEMFDGYPEADLAKAYRYLKRNKLRIISEVDQEPV